MKKISIKIIKSISILLLTFIYDPISFWRINYFCSKCIYNIKTLSKSFCSECPFNVIFKGINVHSEEETLDEIIYNNKSISRFGDGEFRLIFGYSIGFQKYNKILSQKLLRILNSNENNLLIGVNIKTRKEDIEKLSVGTRRFYLGWINKNKFKIRRILNKSKHYYSTFITRFYMAFKNKTAVPQYLGKLKKIWDKKDILMSRKILN